MKRKALHDKFRTMSTGEYLNALKQLGLTTSSQATAVALGTRMRQLQRIGSGDIDVPSPVALLLDIYIQHGLPDWVQQIAAESKDALSSAKRK